jgi:cell division protein FtsL
MINQNKMKQKEYKPTRQDKSRAEMAAIGTMIMVTVIVIALILVINLIFNI